VCSLPRTPWYSKEAPKCIKVLSMLGFGQSRMFQVRKGVLHKISPDSEGASFDKWEQPCRCHAVFDRRQPWPGTQDIQNREDWLVVEKVETLRFWNEMKEAAHADGSGEVR
jgi:hypothetical protein